MIRNRILYVFLLLATMVLGLSSRHFSEYLPVWNRLYLGDTLWALMVFFMVGFVFVRKSSTWVATAALAFSFGIEFLQLYHAQWIDAIRATRIGGLILGFGFLWSDLVCYSVGIGVGYLVENVFKRMTRK